VPLSALAMASIRLGFDILDKVDVFSYAAACFVSETEDCGIALNYISDDA
jgi:hypothetical protein